MIKKENFVPKLAAAFMLTIAFTFSAYALNYSGSQGNPATFETLEETRASSPAAVAQLETNNGKRYKSHPVLDSYPKGTTLCLPVRQSVRRARGGAA